MLRRSQRPAWIAASAVASILVPILAAPAAARQFQMSGTWLVRQGGVFVPLQGAVPQINSTTQPVPFASMGSWTEAPLTGGGMLDQAQVVHGAGLVTATGTTAALVVIPAHRFVQGQQFAYPFPTANAPFIQITSMLQVDAPYAQATLMAAGGPGSFTWCPSNPGCTAGGPVPGVGPTNNGRVIYAAGANRFGGTMQMGLRGGGVTSLVVFSAPLLVGHGPILGSGTTLRRVVVGGGAKDAPSVQAVRLARGYVTAPTMTPPPGGLITAPGPFATTMFGNTNSTPTGVKLQLPAVTPGMTMTGRYTTHVGFPQTTGTVLVQQTQGTGRDELFSVMGSDARTIYGAGNLNTVAGGLALRSAYGTGSGVLRTRIAQFDKLFLTFGPPVPSLSPAGVAAAGLLMLFGAGYARRAHLG